MASNFPDENNLALFQLSPVAAITSSTAILLLIEEQYPRLLQPRMASFKLIDFKVTVISSLGITALSKILFCTSFSPFHLYVAPLVVTAECNLCSFVMSFCFIKTSVLEVQNQYGRIHGRFILISDRQIYIFKCGFLALPSTKSFNLSVLVAF